jgi:hypothetical protein
MMPLWTDVAPPSSVDPASGPRRTANVNRQNAMPYTVRTQRAVRQPGAKAPDAAIPNAMPYNVRLKRTRVSTPGGPTTCRDGRPCSVRPVHDRDNEPTKRNAIHREDAASRVPARRENPRCGHPERNAMRSETGAHPALARPADQRSAATGARAASGQSTIAKTNLPNAMPYTVRPAAWVRPASHARAQPESAGTRHSARQRKAQRHRLSGAQPERTPRVPPAWLGCGREANTNLTTGTAGLPPVPQPPGVPRASPLAGVQGAEPPGLTSPA